MGDFARIFGEQAALLNAAMAALAERQSTSLLLDGQEVATILGPYLINPLGQQILEDREFVSE